MQGIFLFETSRDSSQPHKMLGSFFWQSVTRIQYDKSRFQLSVQQKGEAQARKVKFYVSEVKAKVMFDLASAHHKFYMQNRWRPAQQATTSEAPETAPKAEANVEYREPKMRSLKNRLLSSASKAGGRQAAGSQRRMYTKVGFGGGGGPISGSLTGKRATSAKLLVKRLTHYASMADAAAESAADGTTVEIPKTAEEALAELNASDKENQTPNTARRMQSYQPIWTWWQLGFLRKGK